MAKLNIRNHFPCKNFTKIKPNIKKLVFTAVFSAGFFFFPASRAYAKYNPEYIEQLPMNFAIKTYLSKVYASLTFTDDNGREHTYLPNNPVTMGAGISVPGLTLSGGYGFSFFKDKDKGDTESSDIQAYVYKRNFLVSFFIQKYRGFYLQDSNASDENYIRPDIKVTRIGVNAEYIFNGEEFSFRSSFSQKEKQIKSAGTLLLGGGFYYDQVGGDSNFLPDGRTSGKQDISNVQFGPAVGYAYTLVIARHLSLTGVFSIGMNVGFSIVNSERVDTKLYPMISPRFALNYVRKDWGLSLTYANSEETIMDYEGKKISLSTGKFMLTYSYRFNFSQEKPTKFRQIFYRNKQEEQVIRTVPVKPAD